MKQFVIILLCSFLLLSCKKDTDKPNEKDEIDRVVNGVNVNIAVSTFNSFRTQGIPSYPSVEGVLWNDTLSDAAYNFAKAKTEDTGIADNSYTLSNGQFILYFPSMLNYSRNANFALYYAFPADADVETVINAGFASNDQMILAGLMDADSKQFGMGQFGEKWYVIMSD